MKKRLLYYELEPYIEHKNALVITGMRQVGKTTLLKQIYDSLPIDSEKLIFDFDNPIDTKLFEDVDYKNIYKKLLGMTKANDVKKLYVFVDEIQNFPEITKIIKYLIDHYKVKFFVTGSSHFYLRNLFPESLSGRKFLYHLTPLTFKEYLYFKDKLSLKDAMKSTLPQKINAIDLTRYKDMEIDYEDYLKFGGYPEVVITKNKKEKREILKNIFQSFFEKDLKYIADYNDIREIRDLILLIAPRVGSMPDITKLASELQINRPKVYSYLEFLSGTFFINLISKFSKSADRTVAGGKKIYFSDTGLLNILTNVNPAQLLENAVCNQLLSYGDLHFYNKRNTAEIDFVLNKEIGFEVKTTGIKQDMAALKKNASALKLKNHYIISKNYTDVSPKIIFASQL